MSEKRFFSHYSKLAAIAENIQGHHFNGIATNYLSPIFSRTDRVGVFDEGANFSGIVRQGNAEACLTATAAPHVAPTLPIATLISSAENIMGRQVTLPEGAKSTSHVSPQLIIWWRKAGSEEVPTDMSGLSTFPSTEIDDFTDVMDTLTTQAVAIINTARGKPTVWGSWGNGSPEERAKQGKSRGVPTNNFGHLHISHFDPSEQHFRMETDLSATERLNHYAPWNVLFHQEFEKPIAKKMKTILNNFFDSTESIDVIPTAEFVTNQDGTSSSHYGYNVQFKQPESFKNIYKMFIGISGIFEEFYQRMNNLFEQHYKTRSKVQRREEVEETIVKESIVFGFTQEVANKLKQFILAIKPTYGQLKGFESEISETIDETTQDEDLGRIRKEIARYDRVRATLGDDFSKDSLSDALIRDTVTPPDQWRSIERTWPVHFSAAFTIDDINLGQDETKVAGFKIYPGIASSEASVERILGMVLKRPLSY